MPGTIPALPPGWTASPVSDGAVDLRVSARARPYLVIAAGAATAVWIVSVVGALIADRALPLAASPVEAILLAGLLSAFTSWCAFGDERWRLSSGVIEHRVGLRRIAYVRRIEDQTARLMIADGYGRRFDTPFFRLYAVTAGRRQFIAERKLADLKALGRFIATYTGWNADTL